MIHQTFALLLMLHACLVGTPSKTNVYLIPGQGADERLYNNLQLDDKYEVHNIKFVTPIKGATMSTYAEELAKQIDQSSPFVLIGTSIGGMIATEMNDFLTPKKTIIISSAKSRHELPKRYTFQDKFPLYKIFPSRVIKIGAKIMQPLVEPDRNNEVDIFKAMLDDKDPKFLKRTISMIVSWERETYNENIVHIHGDRDKTIPIRNTQANHKIEDGSHMMILTRGDDLSELINVILKEE